MEKLKKKFENAGIADAFDVFDPRFGLLSSLRQETPETMSILDEYLTSGKVTLATVQAKVAMMTSGAGYLRFENNEYLGRAAAVVGTDQTCGICLADSKEPLILPCGHSFCDGCLHGLRRATLSRKK